MEEATVFTQMEETPSTVSYTTKRNRWFLISAAIEIAIYIAFGRVAHVCESYPKPEFVYVLRDYIGEPVLFFWLVCLVSILAMKIAMVYRLVCLSNTRVKYWKKYGWLSLHLLVCVVGIPLMAILSGEKDFVEYSPLFIGVILGIYFIANFLIAIVGAGRHKLNAESDVLDLSNFSS